MDCLLNDLGPSSLDSSYAPPSPVVATILVNRDACELPSKETKTSGLDGNRVVMADRRSLRNGSKGGFSQVGEREEEGARERAVGEGD